jgi:hypothetical protein
VNGERENNERYEPPKHSKDGFIYFMELKNHMAFPQEVLEDWLLSLMSTLVMGFGPQD